MLGLTSWLTLGVPETEPHATEVVWGSGLYVYFKSKTISGIYPNRISMYS